MLFILIFSFLASANQENNEKLSKVKGNKRNYKGDHAAKNHLSKKMSKRQNNSINTTKSIGKNSQNLNKKVKKNKYRLDDGDSFIEVAENLRKLKAGIDIYKNKDKYRGNNYDINNNQSKQANQRNKMFDILDQIRERYAPPTTPISRITLGSIFITLLAIIIIIVIAYFMISRFYKIKSSEINDEELPLMLGQINQDQHDLSVHGFSKI